MFRSSLPVYMHRQVGWVMIVGSFVPVVCLVGILATTPSDRSVPPMLLAILTGVSALMLVGFSSLATYVTATHVVLRFGVGIYKRAIPLEQIRAVATTSSRWYEGWGIRWTTRGMLYNVAGFETVRLDLVGGKSLRIGSDDADHFRNAIARALGDRDRRGSTG